MIISTTRQDLQNTLAVVSLTVNSAEGVDLASQYVFRVKDGKVEVLAFNKNRLSSISPLQVSKVDPPNSDTTFTVEGARFSKWLSAIPEADITLTVSETAVSTLVDGLDSVMEFRSFEPTHYPYWDDDISSAKELLKADPKRFSAILSHIRSFARVDHDTTQTDLTVAEVQKGTFNASDAESATMVDSPLFKDVALRIHASAFGALVKFLSTFNEEDELVVSKAPHMTFYRRPDGAVFGESEFKTALRDVKVDKSKDPTFWWELSKSDLLQGLRLLSVGAEKTENRLTLERTGSSVRMSVPGPTGKDLTFGVKIQSGSPAGTDKESVRLSSTVFSRIISLCDDKVKLDHVRHVSGTRGYTRIVEVHDADTYLMLVPWLLS